MRYDEKNGIISVSCRELVSVARRGVSAATCDSDEPQLCEASRRLAMTAAGGIALESKRVRTVFQASGCVFELTAHVKEAEKCKLWFTAEVDCNPNRPKKEYAAQLRGEGYVAAYCYAAEHGCGKVELTFVYVNSERGDFARVSETVTVKKLKTFFDKCVDAVALYARPEVERVTVRVPSMKALKFPYRYIRDGQSEFVRRAYRTVARGGTLFATAPTGTGKTVSAIYPAVRAMGEGKRDKTFYFTPKETTAKAAVDCIELLAKNGAVIRAVKITAKEKLCRRGLLCRTDRTACEGCTSNSTANAALALYDLQRTVVTAEEINEIATRYGVCPYELSLTYAELCDLVICDFNYLFDPSVYIRRFFTYGGNYIFLIDEAHNLPDRAREMYSAETDVQTLTAVAESKLLGEYSKTKKLTAVSAEKFAEILTPYIKDEIRTDGDGRRYAATHLKEVPIELYGLFDELKAAVEDEIFINYAAKDEEKSARISFLRDFYGRLNRFYTVMQRFDGAYEVFIFYSDGDIRVKLFCIDTGREIAERLSKGSAAVFFSATLTPLYYYKALLGGDGTSDMLELESPFDTTQLSVSVMDKISTRTSEREDTLSAVCRVIAATLSAKRGNYMIFSPSFAYAEALSKLFQAKYPKLKVLCQKKNMTQKERRDFLDEFSKDGGSYLVGFCVLGGIYSEGIDLAGDRLIGAVIVGIGMPALSCEREAICAYYDEKYEEGRQFAYIYPGMNRVLQAAGRVIRNETDRGVIVLVDDRFDDPIYKKIMPSLWKGMKFIPEAKALREKLDEFWRKSEPPKSETKQNDT